MDWNAQIGRDLRALDGIAAILLALAGLAERAAGAPLPVRWLVLWLLRYAEQVVTELVVGSTCGATYVNGSPLEMTMPHGYSPADAIDLALSLSRLASAVAILAKQLRREAFLHRGQASGKSLDRDLRDGTPGGFGMTIFQVGRPDTS